MQALRSNEWIQGHNATIFSITPLVTPNVLSLSQASVVKVQHQISATMDAFHKAHRAGFRLQDVTKAPLFQRRKLKRSSSSSTSTDSVHSQGCVTPTKHLLQGTSPARASPAMRNSPTPLHSSPLRNLSNNSQASSTSSMGFTPHVGTRQHLQFTAPGPQAPVSSALGSQQQQQLQRPGSGCGEPTATTVPPAVTSQLTVAQSQPDSTQQTQPQPQPQQQQQPRQSQTQSTASSKQSLESSGYFSFKESRIQALLPTTTPLADTDFSSMAGSSRSTSSSLGASTSSCSIDSIPLTASASPAYSQNPLKRSHSNISSDEDEDDCFIIEARPGYHRDQVNNNNNNTKRPRSDTIVIE